MAVQVKRGHCFLCWNTCGTLVTVDDGRILSVEGDPECPLNQGWMCERGQKACIEMHDHPDRLNYPLKRVGERGENKWEQISWDQAIDEISSKLAKIRDQYGPEALMCGGGTGHGSGADWIRARFMHKFGSPNWYYQGINCGGGLMTTQSAMYGGLSISAAIPGVTKAIVLWGYNPANSWMIWWPSFLQAKEQGAKFIVIDPRLTETASFADEWIKIRPGTDGALALGLIHILIEEGIYDHDFVEKWTVGFEELAKRAKPYTPERTAEITSIPKEKIIELAHLYVEQRPVCPFGHLNWIHLGPASNSALIYTAALPAISGNMEVPGGTQIAWPLEKLRWNDLVGLYDLIDHPLRTRDVVGAEKSAKGVKTMKLFNDAALKIHPEGLNTPYYMMFPPLRAYWDAILTGEPYPIKAAIFQGTNVFSCHANTPLIHKALKSPNLELSVTMDLFMTPTAMLSDYVLPAADYFERPELYNLLGIVTYYAAFERVLDQPAYERHSDFELWRDLGRRLGVAQHWPETQEDLFTMQLEPWGMDFKRFANEVKWYFPEQKSHFDEINPRTGKIFGFPTPSGKLEIKSSLLEQIGVDPLPDYEEPLWSPVRTPEMAKEYPLILITGSRTREYQHGEHRMYASVRRMHPWPQLEIHPETARRLDIANGDWVYIETPLGRVRQKARCIEGIDPRVVHAEAYWWYPEKPGEEPSLFGAFESNVNAIIPDDYETLNFGADNYFRGLLCKVYKAPEIVPEPK